MTQLWDPQEEQVLPKFGAVGILRLLLRIVPMAIVTFGGLALLLILRLIERPIFGKSRPLTPWITQSVCRTNLIILGIRLRAEGQPMQGRGAIVANHASWLDIFSLNARDRIYFVSKHEVERWPVIGWLARATGTVFVERRAGAAKQQEQLFVDRLSMGHRLLFFPEGTSTDGRRILDFKSTLFAAFFNENAPDDIKIQPVSVIYTPRKGQDDRFLAWWGLADFGPHFAAILSAPGGGLVEIFFHDPLAVADFSDRKQIAAAAQKIVLQGFTCRQRITSK